MRTLVPVSVRAAGDHTANNQVSTIIARLQVGVADPVERLDATREQMDELKASHEADAGEFLDDAGRVHAADDPGARPAVGRPPGCAASPQHTVHTVTTNVPGPQYPLYALGREMVEYLPYVPLSQGVRIGVAILSYNGQVRFGVTGDYDTMPEVDWFCRRIEAGIAELTERARSPPTRRRRAEQEAGRWRRSSSASTSPKAQQRRCSGPSRRESCTAPP